MSKFEIKRMVTATIAVATAAILLLGIIFSPMLAYAAPESGAGFSVRALLPDNQLDARVSYFDLRMEPNQVQQLEVEITNESSEPVSVAVGAISASTNRNGIIDYKTPDIRDETLKHPFSEIATVDTPTIEVAANSTSIATITLKMPKESYDGVVLGGLVFTGEPEERDVQEKESVGINNAYSYVIGAKLSETNEVIEPNFEIVGVTPQLVNYRPMLVHGIRNTEAAIVKNMNVSVSVKDSHGEVHAEITKDNVDMAPNSVLPLNLEPKAVKLVAGDYVSDIQIEYDGQVYEYQTEFTVENDEVEEVNSSAVGMEEFSDDGMDDIFIFIIAALLVIIVALLIILIVKRRKRDKDTQD